MGKAKTIKLPSGAITCIYLVTYSLGRVWIEGLRTDPLCLGALPPLCEGGIRVAQIMSLALLTTGLIGLWWTYLHRPKIYKGQKTAPKRSL